MPNHELLKTDIPKIMEISDVAVECKDAKSFFFSQKLECKPGQFIMVWSPGIDEKPFAVSYIGKNEFAFTSQAIGRFTNALDKFKKGDKVGIRGPYGNCFTAKHRHGERVSSRASHATACIVGGGVGMASLATLIDVLKNPIIINGARSKEHLIYLKRFKNKNMLAATDDGSYGRKGFTTDVLEEVLSQNKTSENRRFSWHRKSDNCERVEVVREHANSRAGRAHSHVTGFSREIGIVYTCGPEIMMKKVLEICNKHKVGCEASVERHMSCGFGICGKCMINDKMVCIDGPVFNSKQLSKMPEFGKFARLKSGRKVVMKEYHATH